MSLTAHLYRASRDRRSALQSSATERRQLDPALVRAMERVVDRELPAYRAARIAARGERELVDRLAHEPSPQRPASPPPALPSIRPAPRRTVVEPCSICGGEVVVQHLDLTTGAARLECSECGRHWDDTLDPGAERMVG